MSDIGAEYSLRGSNLQRAVLGTFPSNLIVETFGHCPRSKSLPFDSNCRSLIAKRDVPPSSPAERITLTTTEDEPDGLHQKHAPLADTYGIDGVPQGDIMRPVGRRDKAHMESMPPRMTC
jgi:hypothetical protein